MIEKFPSYSSERERRIIVTLHNMPFFVALSVVWIYVEMDKSI